MRVLELCLSRDLGGLELYAYRCAVALRGTDKVVGVIHPEGKLRAYFEKAALPVRFLRHRFRALPLFTAWRLARLVDAEAIEVIHVHHGKDLPLAVLAKVFSRRRPRVVYTRQMQITRAKRDPYHDFLYDNLDCLITITEGLAGSVREKLRERHRDRVRTLYYGVKAPAAPLSPEERTAIRAEWDVSGDAFVVGLFGRKEEAKGQHLMLEAIASLKQRGIDVHAVLVGHAMNSAYVARLESMLRELDIADRVVMRDFVDDPQRWMQACDAVALTTYEETFGLVLAEAMRAGVAVIGSDRGGVPEIIEHGRTGLLFRSGEAASLAECLARLAQHPAEREELARAGKEEADVRFNDERHFAALRGLFEAAMDQYDGPVLEQSPERIGIIAWGLLGDTLLRSAIVEAVARRYPEARITVSVDPWAMDVFAHHPDVDEVLSVNRRTRSRRKRVANLWRLVRQLRERRLDLIIDLYSGGSSALVMALAGARYRLGVACNPAHRLVCNLLGPCVSGCIHWSAAYGSILAPLGLSHHAVRRGTSFHYPPEAAKAVEGYLTAPGPYVGINLGARVEAKRWPVESFVAFAEEVSRRYGLTPLVFTNPGQEQLAAEFRQRYQGRPCVNPPVLPLQQVGALMDRCDFVVTGDTGLLHVACGLKRPTLALFTSTRPEIVMAEDAPAVICLREDPDKPRDDCGRFGVSRDLAVDYVLERFEVLVSLARAGER